MHGARNVKHMYQFFVLSIGSLLITCGTNLTFVGPCIAIHFYSKTNQMHKFLKFILFWNNTLHVSDGLSVHHQEFKTVHTATGICQTGTVACSLASSVCLLVAEYEIAQGVIKFL